jgi:hypothetical protein
MVVFPCFSVYSVGKNLKLNAQVGDRVVPTQYARLLILSQ